MSSDLHIPPWNARQITHPWTRKGAHIILVFVMPTHVQTSGKCWWCQHLFELKMLNASPCPAWSLQSDGSWAPWLEHTPHWLLEFFPLSNVLFFVFYITIHGCFFFPLPPQELGWICCFLWNIPHSINKKLPPIQNKSASQSRRLAFISRPLQICSLVEDVSSTHLNNAEGSHWSFCFPRSPLTQFTFIKWQPERFF